MKHKHKHAIQASWLTVGRIWTGAVGVPRVVGAIRSEDGRRYRGRKRSQPAGWPGRITAGARAKSAGGGQHT
ncbi:hypothetical protein BO71DRAFT_401575 [Aspergillus ellipticus CBS 707.79]|uniref:Uncharacterized protein n=1 Tax=Aspergillus ellipticus CBS 707.79 TaxID=1448320 RepID=A0A319EJW1_9EURO|nr:hypothetical protein BO71DRAFT_403553 [Aspergillus ellipticus CBS 707.79]PYH91242.1 hypothetical protein BO71DRAFT_401575 [Aspergillus ellipticus CBS 707.79]